MLNSSANLLNERNVFSSFVELMKNHFLNPSLSKLTLCLMLLTILNQIIEISIQVAERTSVVTSL